MDIELAKDLKAAGWPQDIAVTWDYPDIFSEGLAFPSLEQLLADFRERGYTVQLIADSKWTSVKWLVPNKLYGLLEGKDPTDDLIARAWIQEFGKKETE